MRVVGLQQTSDELEQERLRASELQTSVRRLEEEEREWTHKFEELTDREKELASRCHDQVRFSLFVLRVPSRAPFFRRLDRCIDRMDGGPLLFRFSFSSHLIPIHLVGTGTPAIDGIAR